MIGKFADGGYTWRYIRLWPTKRHLVWCVEWWPAGMLQRHQRMLRNTKDGPRD